MYFLLNIKNDGDDNDDDDDDDGDDDDYDEDDDSDVDDDDNLYEKNFAQSRANEFLSENNVLCVIC